MEMRIRLPKTVLTVLNQLYEMEQKLKKHGDPGTLSRNVTRIKDAFAEEGLPDSSGGHLRLVYEDPINQPFNETRTDLDASISGTSTEDLVVVQVIKPIIRAVLGDGVYHVVQKGIVVVESRKG